MIDSQAKHGDMPPIPPSDFEIWTKYEDVAMHFNGLLIQFRAQVAGGLALFVTLSSYIAEGKISDARARYTFVAAASGFGATTLLAVACMDLFYYSRLLETTVTEIVALEAKSSLLRLSTTLKNNVGDTGSTIAGLFYGVAFIGLMILGVWAGARAAHAAPDD